MVNYIDYLVNEALNPGKLCVDIHSHLITLFALVVSMKAKTVLELGVRTGCSTLPFLLGVEATKGFLTSVDLEAIEYVCPKKLSGYWKFVKSDSLEYLSRLDKNVIFDIILVDDWHAYGHVKKELELLEQHVTKSSLILLHDLMATTAPDYNTVCQGPRFNEAQWEGGGPAPAVFGLDSAIWEFVTIPICNGMTILRKKA